MELAPSRFIRLAYGGQDWNAAYLAARILTPQLAHVLGGRSREAQYRGRRRDVMGKTTLVNALLAQVANLNERVVFLEDTRGLLDALNDLGFSYRSVTRWIAQDKTQATKTLTRLRRQ